MNSLFCQSGSVRLISSFSSTISAVFVTVGSLIHWRNTESAPHCMHVHEGEQEYKYARYDFQPKWQSSFYLSCEDLQPNYAKQLPTTHFPFGGAWLESAYYSQWRRQRSWHGGGGLTHVKCSLLAFITLPIVSVCSFMCTLKCKPAPTPHCKS